MIVMTCPNCGEPVEDFDGFGVLIHDECGYCSHPDVYGDKCVHCGVDPAADDFHGWSVTNPSTGKTVTYHVGHLPGRKSVCLYRHEGSVIRTVAFFKDEGDARDFLAFLDTLAERKVAA